MTKRVTEKVKKCSIKILFDKKILRKNIFI